MQEVPKWLLDKNKLWKRTQWKILLGLLKTWGFATTLPWIVKDMSLRARSSPQIPQLQVLLFSTLFQQETLTKMVDQTQPKTHLVVFLRKGPNLGKTFKKCLEWEKILLHWPLSWFWRIPMQRSIHQPRLRFCRLTIICNTNPIGLILHWTTITTLFNCASKIKERSMYLQ